MPPELGYQQGVVTTGQSFAFLPGNLCRGFSGFSGNALFGFTGSAPQLCGTFQNLPNSLTAASQTGPLRYRHRRHNPKLHTHGCISNQSGPRLCLRSVDTLPSSTYFGGATAISGLVLSDPGNPTAGASAAASNMLEIQTSGFSPNVVTVAFNYTINDTGCPGCIDQVQVGLETKEPSATNLRIQRWLF